MPALLLSPQQLFQLVPFVPVLIAWLRHMEPKSAGERFLRGGADMDAVQQALRELLNAAAYNNGELSNTQMRYILSCRDVSLWATGVRVILGESEPRLVPTDVATGLTATLSTLQDADDPDEIAKVMGAALDQLPRTEFAAFGEFCALLRDTGGADNTQQLACLVGPMLLGPRIGSAGTTSAAAAVMEFLIEEAESVFGRVASYPGKKDAMGVRKAPPALARRVSRQMGVTSPQMGMVASPNNPDGRKVTGGGGGSNLGLGPPPGLGPSAGSGGGGSATSPQNSESRSMTESEMAIAKVNKRKNQLRAFFEFRANDRVKDMSECVDDLFQNHDFEDIARGLWERYNMLPPGWQHDLAELRSSGNTKLDWFSETAVGVQKGTNGKGRPVSFVPPVVVKAAPEKKGKNDLIIDEIVDTEQTYRENLEELLALYISQVRDICTGRKGPEAAEDLMLSAREVEAIFGWRIGEITKVSASLQKKLEVVSLVRLPPKSPLGRQGLVGQAFIDIADDLHVYAPYVSAHKNSLQTLEKALAAIASKDQKKGGVGALGASLLQRGKDTKDTMNFVRLWEAVSSSSPRLKGQSIQSLLILPIQRVPRYKLLLGELIKNTDKEHPAHPILVRALELVSVSAKQINEALRQHEKLNKILGDDLLAPSASDAKAGGKINLLYVDA